MSKFNSYKSLSCVSDDAQDLVTAGQIAKTKPIKSAFRKGSLQNADFNHDNDDLLSDQEDSIVVIEDSENEDPQVPDEKDKLKPSPIIPNLDEKRPK